MGNLLRLLSRDDTPKYDVFVDFENAQPTQMEEETYAIVHEVLQHSKRILLELQLYQGAGNAIREAIAMPHNEELQMRAWDAVIPLVLKLREFYEFSQKLDAIVPRILWELSSGPLTPTEHLKKQQALVKQFAEILDFVLTFDDLKVQGGTDTLKNMLSVILHVQSICIKSFVCVYVRYPFQDGWTDHDEILLGDSGKPWEGFRQVILFGDQGHDGDRTLFLPPLGSMTNPAIQNDFSYYRRTVNRLRLANQDPSDEELEVPNELANRMSLFYAHATPMLKVLSDATTRFVAENKDLPIENTTETLGTMAKVCQRMVENPEFCSRFHREDTILFVLRVMVGLIILYDHVHPVGAFSRNAHIDVKGCIKVLKDQPTNVVEGLLNALKYTTKHLNDEATPRHIRSLLV